MFYFSRSQDITEDFKPKASTLFFKLISYMTLPVVSPLPSDQTVQTSHFSSPKVKFNVLEYYFKSKPIDHIHHCSTESGMDISEA